MNIILYPLAALGLLAIIFISAVAVSALRINHHRKANPFVERSWYTCSWCSSAFSSDGLRQPNLPTESRSHGMCHVCLEEQKLNLRATEEVRALAAPNN